MSASHSLLHSLSSFAFAPKKSLGQLDLLYAQWHRSQEKTQFNSYYLEKEYEKLALLLL